MVEILYTFDRRFMRKTFAAVDRHVDVPSAYLTFRDEASGSLPGIPEIDERIETASDLDTVIRQVNPGVIVENHRFESEVLDDRATVYDEYPVVHIRHGASVGRGEIANTVRDLGDRVNRALAPGEHWARQYREGFPDSVDVGVVGLPEADDLVGIDPPQKRRVLYAPTNHNYGGGCYLETAPTVLDVFEGTDYRLRFRPHPMDRIEEPGKSVTETCRERIAGMANVVFDEETTPRESLLWADVLISDYSGIVTEWLHTGRPLVQLTTVAADRTVPQLGETTESLDIETVERLYESGYSPSVESTVEANLADLGIPMDGRAGERAAQEVVACTQ